MDEYLAFKQAQVLEGDDASTVASASTIVSRNSELQRLLEYARLGSGSLRLAKSVHIQVHKSNHVRKPPDAFSLRRCRHVHHLRSPRPCTAS
jgi:hypothetical protein